MDLGARAEFALGEVVRQEEWEAADDDERRALLSAAAPELDDPLLSVRVVLVDQLLADDPPHVWVTAQRLLAEGLDREAVWQQLSIAFAQSLDERVGDDEQVGWDPDTYQGLLDRLPFPSIDAVQQVLVDAAAEQVVVPTDALLAAALDAFGYDQDDEVAWSLVEAAYDSLMSEGAELAAVVSPSGEGDVTVEVPGLVDGVVLTHELDDDERAAHVLMVSFDLAGLERLVDPVLVVADAATGGAAADADADAEAAGAAADAEAAGAGRAAGAGDDPGDAGDSDGTVVELETVYAEDDVLVGWRGPDGWLERYSAGATLAVRHLGDDRVAIEALASPPPVDESLVDELLALYDDAAAESQMPVSGEELVLGWLVRERTAFTEPRPPLTALCQAGGLVWWRPSAVIHDLEQGVNERMALHVASVLPAAEDEEVTMTALAVLDLAERLSLGVEVEPERITRALDELGDADGPVRTVVMTQYFHERRYPDEALAFVETLASIAETPEQAAIAHELSSLATDLANR